MPDYLTAAAKDVWFEEIEFVVANGVNASHSSTFATYCSLEAQCRAIFASGGNLLFGGGSGGGGGLFGSLVSGLTGSIAGGKTGKANGGIGNRGRYLVGERGPEIVDMGGPFHVTPNHKLDAVRGGNRPALNITFGSITSNDPETVKAMATEAIVQMMPMITKTSSDHTMGRLGRPRM